MLRFLLALSLSLAPLSGALAQTGVASGMTVTSGATTNSLATWMSYLAGAANPNPFETTSVPVLPVVPTANVEPVLSVISAQTPSVAVLCTGVANCNHGGDGGGYYHNYLMNLGLDHTQPTLFGVTGFLGVIGEAGAGPTWALNAIANWLPSYTSSANVVEIDSGNKAYNSGSTVGSPGLSSGNQLFGLTMSGNGGGSWLPISSSIVVTCTQSTGCFNRGITVASGVDSVAGASFEDTSHAYQSFYLGGQHQYGIDTSPATFLSGGSALHVAGSQVAVAATPNGGGTDMQLLQLNGSNGIEIGKNSTTPTYFNSGGGGDYLSITAGAAASGLVTLAIPSGSADANAGFLFTPKGNGGFAFGASTASGTSAFCAGGGSNVCSGSFSSALGFGITVAGGRSVGLGQDVNDRTRARDLLFGPGAINGQGDNQQNKFLLHAKTTTTTPQRLSSDSITGSVNTTDCMNLVSSSVMTFKNLTITYVDVTNMATTFWTAPVFQVVDSSVGTVTFVSGSAPTLTQGAATGGLTVAAPVLAIDGSAKCPGITVTAPNTDETHWFSSVDTDEIR